MIQLKMKSFLQKKTMVHIFNNHRIRVSNKSDLEDCLFSTNQDGLKVVFPNLNMRSTGCSALT